MPDINNIFSDLQVDLSVPKPTKVGMIQQRIQTFALTPKFASMGELLTALSGAVASPEILAHLEVMLCVQFEDLCRVVYSPAFRSNSTKYLGVTFKVCAKDKLPHEPGFWLDDINNAAMDDAPSDSETSEAECLQQWNGDNGSDSVDEDDDDDDDDYLDHWHPVEGFEELEHRWKRFSSTALDNAVLWGGYIRQPHLAIANAQAEAYTPDILHLYSHLVPQFLINDVQEVNTGSEEGDDDAESVNQGSPGAASSDMDSDDNGGEDGSDDESVCLSVIEVMDIDSSLEDSDYEP